MLHGYGSSILDGAWLSISLALMAMALAIGLGLIGAACRRRRCAGWQHWARSTPRWCAAFLTWS